MSGDAFGFNKPKQITADKLKTIQPQDHHATPVPIYI